MKKNMFMLFLAGLFLCSGTINLSAEVTDLGGQWWRTTNYSRNNEYGVNSSYWSWATYNPDSGFNWNDNTPCDEGRTMDFRWIKGDVFVPLGVTAGWMLVLL